MGRLSSNLEDYLEAIWTLGHEGKSVRIKSISEMLHVKSPSVVGALKVLSGKGLVRHERYGYVELTEEGNSLAREVYRKHSTLAEFFTEVLAVDAATAARDACAAEHCLSNTTLERIKLLTGYMRDDSNKNATSLKRLRSYVQKQPKAKKK